MLPKNPPKIYFKHVYGSDVNEWGCVGFPSYKSASAAGGIIDKDDVVLLAITNNPKLISKLKPNLKGRIYAICQLRPQHVLTANIANPELIKRHPEIARNWKEALTVARIWHLDEPKIYSDFGMGEITRRAASRRGHLIDIEDSPVLRDEVRCWYNSATGQEQDCFRSDRALQLPKLKRLYFANEVIEAPTI